MENASFSNPFITDVQAGILVIMDYNSYNYINR
jgi:hypothetical protein